MRPFIPLCTQHDLALEDFFEGCKILGGTGSGKSSTTGKTIAQSFLRAGMGGLVLTAKASEVEVWKRYAIETGRQNDLLIFDAEGGHLFDPIHYEWVAGGKNTESLVEVFDTLLSIGRNHADTSADRFWDNAVQELMRNSIQLLFLAGEPISIRSIDRLIRSLPSRPGEYETPEWQQSSYCASVIQRIRQRQDTLTEDQWADLDHSTYYTCIKWPSLDERTRSNILATWSGLASKFSFNPLARIFNSGRCTFIPEMTTHQSKIIIVAFPLLVWNETGKLINCALKLIFQRAWLRRDLAQCDNPAFLWADEMQFFILPKGRDNAFQQVCRASRIATVYLTQNILNISEALGEHQLGSKTKALLANLTITISHSQTCTETNQFMSDQIGKELVNLQSKNFSGGGFSLGTHEQLMYRIEPDFFSRLKKPNQHNPQAEVLVFHGGRLFGDKNYLLTTFSR